MQGAEQEDTWPKVAFKMALVQFTTCLMAAQGCKPRFSGFQRHKTYSRIRRVPDKSLKALPEGQLQKWHRVAGRYDEQYGLWTNREPYKVDKKFTQLDQEFGNITKFESQMQSLQLRGFQRPYKPYKAPHDVEERFFKVCSKILGLENKSDLSQVKLEGNAKADLLGWLTKEFDGHRVPNSMIHTMNSLDKVFTFYSLDVDQLSPYDRLEAGVRQGVLPQNLHVQLEPHRFDPENATSDMDKITAFPRSSSIMVSPEARKKWKDVIAKYPPWRTGKFEREDL